MVILLLFFFFVYQYWWCAKTFSTFFSFTFTMNTKTIHSHTLFMNGSIWFIYKQRESLQDKTKTLLVCVCDECSKEKIEQNKRKNCARCTAKMRCFFFCCDDNAASYFCHKCHRIIINWIANLDLKNSANWNCVMRWGKIDLKFHYITHTLSLGIPRQMFWKNLNKIFQYFFGYKCQPLNDIC